MSRTRRAAPAPGARAVQMRRPAAVQKALRAGTRRSTRRLQKPFSVDFDDTGSIGKRYRRQDEIGTPFCVTYDFESPGGRLRHRARPRHHGRRSALRSTASSIILQRRLLIDTTKNDCPGSTELLSLRKTAYLTAVNGPGCCSASARAIISMMLGAAYFGMPMFYAYFTSPMLVFLNLLPPAAAPFSGVVHRRPGVAGVSHHVVYRAGAQCDRLL